MMRTIVSVLMLGAVMLSTGCKKKSQAPNDTASVMFVNGCPGSAQNMDAKADDKNVDGGSNISFRGNSGYRYVKAGSSVKLDFYITNLGTPVTSQLVNITAGKHYSAYAAGVITNPKFVIAEDDLTSPGTNSAKIRFVNLSNDLLSVTANVQNDIIASGLGSLAVSGYLTVQAGNYELKAGDPTNINTVVTTGVSTLAAGVTYTLMLTGTLTGSGESALKLTLIANK